MEDSTRMGHNRTGLAASPLQAELAVPARYEGPADVDQADSLLSAGLRREYVSEADALGSIPPPTSMKGVVRAGVGALKGKRVHAFLDKVAERLAFERGGTRIYDALLVKIQTLAEGTPVNMERAKQIRRQEAQHARLLEEALEMLGGDPTAQTPSADLVGVQAQGLMQSVADPRTTLVQTLNSVLAAELIDVAGWDLLAQLARAMGEDELANRFDEALAHENEHLLTIRGWVEALVLSEVQLVS